MEGSTVILYLLYISGFVTFLVILTSIITGYFARNSYTPLRVKKKYLVEAYFIRGKLIKECEEKAEKATKKTLENFSYLSLKKL